MSNGSHPFFGDHQYEQQYGFPSHGRPGNGLGDVGGQDPLLWEAAGNHSYSMRPSDYSDSVNDGETEAPEFAKASVGDLVVALSQMTAKQQFVIVNRYGLFGRRAHSLFDVASSMGVTNQAVSRIELRALETLRRLMSRTLVEDAY